MNLAAIILFGIWDGFVVFSITSWALMTITNDMEIDTRDEDDSDSFTSRDLL